MQELFPTLSQKLHTALIHLPKALQATLPLSAKHRKQLPLAIEELSLRLTSERGIHNKPYWSAPRLTAAYMWYFLPWNIIRLTRLLGGLELPEPTPLPTQTNGPPLPRIMADMGSGPLSLPIALWLAKPQWRTIPLTLLCTDAAPHPLQLGQKLFYELAGADSPWRIVTARAPIDALGKEIQKIQGIPWLITAANVCNEIKSRHGQTMEERFDDFMERLSPILEYASASQNTTDDENTKSNNKNTDCSLLFIEPGTRLGGKTIVTLRQAGIEQGLYPLAPCVHEEDCPLIGSRTWCHFTFDVQGSPPWLTSLSTAANLRKDALSLSFILLGTHKKETQNTTARIISAPFPAQGLQGRARYACCEQGLALLGKADRLSSGALVALKPETKSVRTDAKSGALILEHAEKI